MSVGKIEIHGGEKPIEWRVPDNLPALRATNLTISATDGEIIVQFFEVKPPLLIGSPENVQARANEITSIPAICLARFVISPARLRDFAKVFSDFANEITPGG